MTHQIGDLGQVEWANTTDGRLTALEALPPGGASDSQVAGYVSDTGSDTAAAVDTTVSGLVADPDSATGAALSDTIVAKTAGTYVAFGTAEPAPPSGVEVVWFKTDGAGNVIDILSGVGA